VKGRRVLVTGATGCVGHYVVETLMRDTPHELFLLVRDPARLRLDWRARPGVTLVAGDLETIETHAGLLSTMDAAVLAAAAWGGPAAEAVNVRATLALLRLLDPARCDPVVYFSTASILDEDHRLLAEAERMGTEYIRSKLACARALADLPIASRVITLFPTLVIGGDAGHPYSNAALLLREALRWIGLARFFTADASFHFIHARDIARVVRHLLDTPGVLPPPRALVLGSPRVTVDEALGAACTMARRRVPFRLRLTERLARVLIAAFRVQMSPWDRYCMMRRHLVYREPVGPARFGLPTDCPDIASALRSIRDPAPAGPR
jgi:nucleoside-diphosphate-sugar epimerase